MTRSFLNSLKNIDFYEIDLPKYFRGYEIDDSKTLDTTRFVTEEWSKKNLYVTRGNNGLTLIKIPYDIGGKKFLKDARSEQRKIFLVELERLIERYKSSTAQDSNLDRYIIALLRTYLRRDRVDTYLNEYMQIVHLGYEDRKH